jgi:regulator of protease activity HflC (stomatin/prohibitin superfamily)
MQTSENGPNDPRRRAGVLPGPEEPEGRYNRLGMWVPAERDRKGRLRGGARERVSAFLVAVGLRRPRRPDGTLGPRAWGRLGLMCGGALLVVFVATAVHVVPPGNVAVPVTLGRPGGAIGPGVHVTWPLTTTRNLSIRTEQYTMTARSDDGAVNGGDDAVLVLGRDGGSASVDATVLYQLDRDRAAQVYRSVGTNLTQKVIRPSARSCIRSEFTNYALVDAATTSWHDVETDVAKCMADRIEPRGLVLQEFQLREVDLGDQVQQSIDEKVAAQQNAEKQQFDLAAAQQKAEITRVDATATADAQQILACGSEITTVEKAGQTVQVVQPKPIERCSQAQLTPQYLQFTYIQALKQLVDSPNNSTIILPFDQQLTPLLNVNGGGAATPPSVR